MRLLFTFCVLLASTAVYAQERSVDALPLDAVPQSVLTFGSQISIKLKNGEVRGYKLAGHELKSEKPVQPKAEVLPHDALPDAVIGKSNSDIREAWLTRPTKRYAHGVLGDGIEAGGFKVETASGEQLEFVLPETEVFEDRYARVVDLEGDGRAEVVVVNSHADLGAALAVFGIRDGKLVRIARTPFIGTANRWLNPAAIADFDGNSVKEIAIVVTPHIGGNLQFWELDGKALKLAAEIRGFSNHFIGSRVQEMSVVLKNTKTGALEVILPSADRRSLKSVSLANGKAVINWQLELPARVTTEIVAVPGDKKSPTLVMGLSDKTVISVH
ncbi:MAG: hypothetical protein ACR2OJ_16585 [Hyphomicrobiales bacterium]